MALSVATQFEVRTTGADTNGGGFVAGATGTDWSKQDAAQYSVTDAVTAGTTTITSATANFGTDVVGNILYIQGGTGAITAGWYEIVSRTNSTTIVVDRLTGLTLGTGATLKIGGGFLTIAAALAVAIAENTVWIKAGTYTITSGLTASAGASLPNVAPLSLVGYTTTHGDNPTSSRPLITTASAIVLLTVSGNNTHVSSLEFDGQDTGTTGVSFTGGNPERNGLIINCKIHRCATRGVNLGSGVGTGAAMIRCELTDMKAGATDCVAVSSSSVVDDCYIHDSPGHGINFVGNNVAGVRIDGNVIANIGTGGTGHGVNAVESLGTVQIEHNTITGCTGDGIRADTSYRADHILSNILYLNGGYEIKLAANSRRVASLDINYNCMRNAVSGLRLGYVAGPNEVTLTADPFTNAAGGDYSLNATAGGGAACRAAGYPGAFPGGLATGYLDAGALQHQDAGGSGGVMLNPGMSGGMQRS